VDHGIALTEKSESQREADGGPKTPKTGEPFLDKKPSTARAGRKRGRRGSCLNCTAQVGEDPTFYKSKLSTLEGASSTLLTKEKVKKKGKRAPARRRHRKRKGH